MNRTLETSFRAYQQGRHWIQQTNNTVAVFLNIPSWGEYIVQSKLELSEATIVKKMPSDALVQDYLSGKQTKLDPRLEFGQGYNLQKRNFVLQISLVLIYSKRTYEGRI